MYVLCITRRDVDLFDSFCTYKCVKERVHGLENTNNNAIMIQHTIPQDNYPVPRGHFVKVCRSNPMIKTLKTYQTCVLLCF